MKQNNSGFTLVELLVTMLVLGVIATGLSSLFISIQRTQVQTNHLESATRAGQREIESLRNDNYNNLTAGQTINFSSSLPTSLPQGSTGIVQVSEPTSGLKRVDVTVTYTYNGSVRDVKLSSLIGVIGITQ